MASIPDVPYKGHYQGQRGVTRAYNSDVDDGPASLNEPANEHVIYTDRMEKIVLPNPKDNLANYTANDAGEWMIV